MTDYPIMRHAADLIAPGKTNAPKIEAAFKEAGQNNPVPYTPVTVLTFLGTTMPSIQEWPRPLLGKQNIYEHIATELNGFGFSDDFADGEHLPQSEQVARMTIADALKTMKTGNPPDYERIAAGCNLFKMRYLQEMGQKSADLITPEHAAKAYTRNS